MSCAASTRHSRIALYGGFGDLLPFGADPVTTAFGFAPRCAAQNCGSFSSNANDTGTLLFALSYDGVAGADPHVVAGIKLAQDILDVYELEQPTYNMVYHTGTVEDGSCMIGVGACLEHPASIANVLRPP